jgi:hypothetical protein
MKSRVSLLLISVALSPLFSSAQTGGDFQITQSVIASGGGQGSTNGNFSVAGTIGQPAAGSRLIGGNFAIRNGFWASGGLSPTAAHVSVSGRVRTVNGGGIRNALVILTAPNGEIRTTMTATFGYYRFTEVPVGATYIVSIISKRYTFAQPTQVITVFENVGELDFVANLNEFAPRSN